MTPRSGCIACKTLALQTSQFSLSSDTSFAYSVSTIGGASGQLATSGEDYSVRIWQGEASGTPGSMMQSITLPAVSVWSVAALADGALASVWQQ